LPEEILHLTEFHPTDDFYGLSRLEVAAKSVDISNLSQEWNAKLLKNDMRPPGAIKSQSLLTDAQFERIRQLIKEKYMGSENAGMPLLFEGGMEWQQLSISPHDMDWLNAEKFNLRRICSIFGVASELLGDSENKTYSNIQEARKALYQEAVLPIMDSLKVELNKWLAPLYGQGIELEYDRDAIEALQEDRAKKYAYLAAADWLTINEKRDACGYDEIDGGDVVLVPISSIPLEQATAEPEPVPDALKPDADNLSQDEQGGAKGKGRRIWATDEQKKALWMSFDVRTRSRSKSFIEMAKSYLKAQAKRILVNASELASVNGVKPEQILNLKDEVKLYVKTFQPWYVDHFIRAGNAGLKATKGELFDDAAFKADKPTGRFNLTPALEEKLMQMIFNSGTKVNETVIDVIYDLLLEAQAQGLTVERFTQKIIAEDFESFSNNRARLWAMTESAKVDNWGQVEGYRQSEFVDQKGWLCMFLPTSREGHEEASGQEVPLDEPFHVGGEDLDHPGDPNGTPGNVCNCHCTTYPIVKEL
jgi:hypothetical protein